MRPKVTVFEGVARLVEVPKTMYRPKGFTRLKAQLIAKLSSGYCAASYANGLEDGADALLEGLKEKRVTHMEANEVLKLRPGDTFESDVPGWLVFIAGD